ncbi:MAG TPA: metalloregulator ArsR/SmtB family transcription factor [Lacisediminihabitans sp.]|uniref:ArsR/SmtB family transcription factor n=1 Tax=Lacisediminihabitans sp. TaxID=2787631 RepID=UPI002EDB06EE
MADIFDVIADATRRDLLQVLLERYVSTDSEAGEISVGEIVEKLGISQPTVSKHLRVLRDHGLVTVREEGQHRFYCIDTSPLEDLEDWLIPFLSADFEGVPDSSSTVFAAWSGVAVPEPIRRAAETLQSPSEAGAAVGRAAAAASFQARNALQDASHEVERRVIEPLKKRLSRKEGK